MNPFQALNGNSDRSQQHHEEHHHDDSTNANNSASSEDGYNWGKYGQKQVKGSEHL
ncbi:putative transcription factor WRKY family [Helianthus annuus]|nr:putative transcription factor WRKY family [Helianthus annuus]